MSENNFGSRVAQLLEQKDMTQRELADKVGVTEVSMSRYVNGTRIPRGPIVANIAKALDVTSDYLLNGTGKNVITFDSDYVQLRSMIARSSLTTKQRNDLISDLLNAPLHDQ